MLAAMAGPGSRLYVEPTLFSMRSPANVDGSTDSSAYGVLQYADPPPVWGTDNGGWGIIRKIKPLATVGYINNLCHSDGGDEFTVHATGNRGYWIFTGYPPGGSSGTEHDWECAIEQDDHTANLNAGTVDVVVGEWRIQGIRITRANANSKTLRFYTNLESISNDTIIEVVETASNYGESPVPTPQITLFNSPWMFNYQEERGACDLDWILMYTPNVDIADIEANVDITDPDAIVAYTGTTNLFWGKRGFTTLDALTCDYGTGRSFVRNDVSNILTLVAR